MTIVSPDREVPQEYAQARSHSHRQIKDQFHWEDYYLESARHRGVILGWLPAETDHSCKHPYGRDTRRELGTFIGLYKAEIDPRLVLGAEEGFAGIGTLVKAFRKERPDFPVYQSLAAVCDAAVRRLDESNA